MLRNVVLFENRQLIHRSSNKSSSRALVLMKNQGNNWGITMDRSWGEKSLYTKVVTFSDVKISALKRPTVLFTFQPVYFPHACTSLYFHSSLLSSPLILLKSEPFIASFTCFVVQRIAFSPFLIPRGYDVCVCACSRVCSLWQFWACPHRAPDRSCHQLSVRAGQSGVSDARTRETTESNHARVNITQTFTCSLANKLLQNSSAVFPGSRGRIRLFNMYWLIYYKLN